MRIRMRVLITLLVLIMTVVHSGCGVPPIPGEAVSVPGNVQSSPSSGEVGEGPLNKPRTDQPSVDAVPGEQNNTRKPVQLIVTGGIGALDSGLFALSSAAKEALPKRMGDYRAQYLEAAPLIERGRVAALSREKYGPEGYAIQLLNIATGQEYNLYRSRSPLSGLIASPTGKWLSFNEGQGKSKRLVLFDLEEEKRFEIDARDVGELPAVFSPDGSQLYFDVLKDGRSAIMRVTVSQQGPGIAEVYFENPEGQKVRFVRFSPDQTSEVLVLSVRNEAQLVLRQPDREPVVVASGKDNVFEPTWSPDGKKILFWLNAKDGQSIRVYDVPSKVTQIVTPFVPPREPGSSVCPAWNPDMTEVYFVSNAGYWDQVYKAAIGERKTILMTDANLARSYSCPKVLPDYEEGV